MTHTRILTLGGAALLALTIGCTAGSDGRPDNGSGGGGGEGGDNGSTGGKKTGGTGGSKSGGTGGTKSGGTGGTKSGGMGGTAAGGTGGTAAGGTGGTAAGGTGGTAAGGTGGTAAGGTGGTKVAGISWDFETEVQGWNNGVDHFNGGEAQCAHGRLGIGQPMVSTEQKATGNSSIKYEIDVVAAKAEYAILCAKYGDDPLTPADDPTADELAKRTPPNGFAVVAPNTTILLALAKKGITNGTIPVGTTIKGSYYFSKSQFGTQVFLVGGDVTWQAVQSNTTGNVWTSFEHPLAKDNTITAFGWYEIGLLFGGLPADFKGTLYLDSIDLVLP
jgi:hypothetical protein